MRYKLSVENPDQVEFRMEITLPLGAWKTLREKVAAGQLGMTYPNYKLAEAINDLVRRAEKTYYFDAEDKP